MREIFKSGSVRELIVTLGLLPQQKVRCGFYSTDDDQSLRQDLLDRQDTILSGNPVNPVDPV